MKLIQIRVSNGVELISVWSIWRVQYFKWVNGHVTAKLKQLWTINSIQMYVELLFYSWPIIAKFNLENFMPNCNIIGTKNSISN